MQPEPGGPPKRTRGIGGVGDRQCGVLPAAFTAAELIWVGLGWM